MGALRLGVSRSLPAVAAVAVLAGAERRLRRRGTDRLNNRIRKVTG